MKKRKIEIRKCFGCGEVKELNSKKWAWKDKENI